MAYFEPICAYLRALNGPNWETIWEMDPENMNSEDNCYLQLLRWFALYKCNVCFVERRYDKEMQDDLVIRPVLKLVYTHRLINVFLFCRKIVLIKLNFVFKFVTSNVFLATRLKEKKNPCRKMIYLT